MSLPDSVQPGTLEHFRREWRTQRALWTLGAATLAASAAGLLGPGPLSRQTIEHERLVVSFDRFVHRHHPTPLRITARRSLGEDDLVIELEGELAEAVRIEAIQPRPTRESRRAHSIAYEFSVVPSTPSVSVSFYLEYEELGGVEGHVVADGQRLPLLQFVYP